MIDPETGVEYEETTCWRCATPLLIVAHVEEPLCDSCWLAVSAGG